MATTNPIKIVAGVPDIFFAAKIGETAKRVGVTVQFAPTQQDILAKRSDPPSLIIVDLDASSLDPVALIGKLKADPELQNTRVLGFVSHVQSDLIQAAQNAGCNEVMARSAFTKNLGEILRRYA